jgi:outer membrane protein assembly factor BamB
MVSGAKGLPATFGAGEAKKDSDEIDLSTTKGVKWVAKLGGAAYGNPTVAGGRVFVGTNNDVPRDAKYQGDYGIVMCLEEATGKLVWQLAAPKLAVGGVSDFEHVGICSSPAVDGERVYVVTNRCEVVCLDVKGMANGNDGPFTDEGQYVAGPGKAKIEVGGTDADIIWRYDLRDELGVFPHQMTSSSVLVVGDKVFATTSNGRDWTGIHIPSPNTPALICLDKRTGKLLGQEESGISRRTYLCNWSSPAVGKINGKEIVVFGGGDGVCYGFDPEPVKNAAGVGVLREIWRYDCNSPQRKIAEGKPVKYGSPKGPSEIIATPVFFEGKVYVAVGQNPEQGDGDGSLHCIDASKTGDITTSGRVWAVEDIPRALATVSVAEGLLYIGDFSGFVRCYDVTTGKMYWKHDTEGHIWGSTLVADGKVYVGSESGLLMVLAAGREKKVLGQVTLDGPVYSSPVVANGVLYVGSEKNLYAIGE